MATWDHLACARGMLQSTEKLNLNTAIIFWKWKFSSWSLHTFLVMGDVWGKLLLSQFLKDHGNTNFWPSCYVSQNHRFPLDHVAQSLNQSGLEHFQGTGKEVFSSHRCSFRDFRTLLHFTGYHICFTSAKWHLIHTNVLSWRCKTCQPFSNDFARVFIMSKRGSESDWMSGLVYGSCYINFLLHKFEQLGNGFPVLWISPPLTEECHFSAWCFSI